MSIRLKTQKVSRLANTRLPFYFAFVALLNILPFIYSMKGSKLVHSHLSEALGIIDDPNRCTKKRKVVSTLRGSLS